MTEEKKVSDTQTIDYFLMYKDLEGLYRMASIQIEEAHRALERSFLKCEEMQKTIKALEGKVRQLQEFAVDEVTNLVPSSLLDRHIEAYMEQFKRLIHHLKDKADLPEKRLIVTSLDLDQFSAVNDKYGRSFGDHILQFVSHVITSRIRKCDIASRQGQRFTVVFVDCTRVGVIMKTREISQRIARENFGASGGEQIQITVTIGIADYDGQITREELLRRADCAMKFGKDNGRYCTVMYAREGGPHELVESYVRNGKA